MRIVPVRMPGEAQVYLREEAERRGVTTSRLIRLAIARFVSESQLRALPMETHR